MKKSQEKIKNKSQDKTKISFFSKLFIGDEKKYFIENLTLLLSSGMDVIKALESIKSEVRSTGMKEIIQYLQDTIEGGSPLWKALDEAGIFPSQIVSLIRVGEQSGKLSENLKVISVQQRKDDEFKSKLRSAMMYPIFVISVALVMGIGIAWYILPRLTGIFAQLNVELPLITRMLIAAGEFFKAYGSIVIPLFILFLICFVFFIFINKKTKFIGQFILFRMPIIKRLIQEIELARFGYILGTLLDAGLPVVESLDSLSESSTFYAYKNLYRKMRDDISEGDSFQKSFSKFSNIKKMIPVPIQQMIVAGEQSGNLSEILMKISDNYEVKTDITTKNLTVILEPILLVIVWIGVVMIALAVIMPIYGLISGFNQY